MTIETTTSRNDYIGNSAANIYSYTFPIFESSDLLVIVADPTNTQTILVLNTDYTVSGVGIGTGGNVTLVSANQAWLTTDGMGNLLTGWTIEIRRVLPLTQETSIRNQGVFFPEVHEDQFDRFTCTDQQIQDEVSRCVQLPEIITPAQFNPVLPATVLTVPGGAIIVNPSGNGLTVGVPAGSIPIPVPFSAGGTGRTDGNIQFNAGNGIIGATDGTFPAAGQVGEILSVYASPQLACTDATWTGVLALQLTPGRWKISGAGTMNENGATMRNPYSWAACISVDDGIPTDFMIGMNAAASVQITGVAGDVSNTIPAFYISITVNTNYYLDIICGFTALGSPQLGGWLSAERIA